MCGKNVNGKVGGIISLHKLSGRNRKAVAAVVNF